MDGAYPYPDGPPRRRAGEARTAPSGRFGARAALLAGAFLAAALATALAGCAGLAGPVLKQPTVDLEEAQVMDLNLERANLRFDFRVGNPNSITLPLSGIEYELLVNGARFLDGVQDRRVDIAARGESRVELPVTIRYQDLFAAFRSLREGRRSDYEIRADFLFDVPLLGRVRVPVSEHGDLPLPGFSSR